MESGVDILQYLQHFEEENKGRNASKVSKIATMFQFSCEDDRDERDGSGPQVTVVRTESHVARFNTARALFEKMAEKKAEEAKCSKIANQRWPVGSQHGVHPACRNNPSQASGKAKSRSPSPASTHSTHHHHHHHPHHQPNGHSFNPSSSQTSISTITSSYTHTPSTFHSSVQNPSIPSVLPLSVRSTLDSEVYIGKRHHPSVVAEIPKSNLDVRNKSEIPKSHHESQVNNREHIGTGNKPFVNNVNNKYEEHNEALHRNCEHSMGKKIEPKSRPNSLLKPDKPAKPETLIDKPLSSHLQNQQIIQRHKNWFQSFSKVKSPVTSPVKPHQPPSPTSKTPNIYEQRNPEDTPGVHTDWRRERSVILKGSGRSSRQEDVDKNSTAGTNVKNFENVPTLPSCWSPPKQYNDLSSTQVDKEHHGSKDAIYSGKVCEDYRRDPSPSNVDNIGVMPDISKDSLNRRHNAHDKHIPGVFKKGHDNTASSPSLSRHEASNCNRNVEYENVRDSVALRHRDDISMEKEKRLKEWEKRLSQRDVQFHTFPDSIDDRNSAEIPASSSISRMDIQFRDSKPERKEEELRKKDLEKRRESVGKEENYLQERFYNEEQERRRLKLQIEKERLTKEEDRTKLRKDDRRERLRNELERKDNERKDDQERIRRDEEISKGEKEKVKKEEKLKFEREQDEREKIRREEQAKLKLRKETEQRDRLMREAEEHERRWREEEKREKLRREEESRERLKREMEEEVRLKRELEEEDRLKREEGRLSLRREEEKERLRKKEEREKLKREKEEMERLKKEEEKERLRREEEERERLKKEKEREILRRGEEERNRLRKEEEERVRLRKEEEKRERLRREEEERERLRREKEERERLKREKEEKERLRKEEEERERLRREEEERERIRREEEEREILRREEEEREKLKREEKERLKREEEERERLKREKEEKERLRREEEERERLKKEKEEKERLRREKEERERLRREEKERLRREEEVRERERLRREEEERERERLRREEEEREKERLRLEEIEREKIKLRKEKEERERLRKEEEEKERLRREEEEKERLRRDEEERERFRREEEERERLRRENEEILRLKRENEEILRLKREEEMERLRKEEEKRVRKEEEKQKLRRENEEKERLRKEEEKREKLRRVAEEERLLKEEEEIERFRKEKEERERREEEIKKLKRDEEERENLKNQVEEEEEVRNKLKRAAEEKLRLGNEAENTDPVEINLKKELERKWQAKREKLEEEERIRREKDRIEIEKTKRRIAELKRERDELQRQQATRLRTMIKDDPDLADKDAATFSELTPDDDLEVEVNYPKRSLPVLQNKTDTDIELIKEKTSSTNDSCTPTISVSHVDVDSQVFIEQAEPSELIECTEFRVEANLRKVEESFSKSSARDLEDQPKGIEVGVDDIAYDHTVLSAQHKLEFCTNSYNDSTSKEVEEKNVPHQEHFSSSTMSSEFEPLPPPVPPHNVDPATLAAEVCIEQQRLPPLPVDAEPEIMTPEEAEKLLSHNIVETRKGLLAEAGELDISNTSSSQRPFSPEGENDRHEVDGANTTKTEQDDAFDKDYDSVCVDSPTPDNDEDDSYGYFKHEVNEEGFVVRAKEVLSEDGVHYLEDGHFWIQVPGLTEDDDEELPESVPVHKHTKLKFSKEPIRLFSTFSVTDYDRRNDDVDPVAASAEYELEKRVEKMNVFPVTIEKGEGGLGLSIIGMGVGADAGVEKLGIFVKTITPGGATDKDGRIQVNDQIIEVDSQSLVGVTQMFAASVLKNTSGTVNFLIGRENDPENSEVAMLIRQSLMADQERDERRRALEGPNYDPRNSGGIFESFSSQSGGESPSEEAPRNGYAQREGHQDPNQYGHDFGEQYGDPYGSCSSSPPEGISSPPPEAYNHDVQGRDLLLQNNEIVIMSQHLQEIQHRNDMYEEEITILRNKICDLEKELGTSADLTKRIQDTTTKLKELEDTLQSRQAEISTYQDMLEQSQGQYIILEKKYYKAKKIIKEYQSRERDFLHREEYHITQLEEKDALYNSLVKALKDRVIQLEGDLIKAQQEAGLPVKVPPDLNSQSSNFVQSKGQDNHSAVQRDPPRKPSTLNNLDADLSDTEGGDTHTSEGSKSSTVERKIPSKEELDVAVPPTELLDNSLSKAKGELASRGHLANRQLPSLKKSASNASASSFDHSFDDLDDSLPESQQPQNQVTTPSKSPTTSTFHSEESIHSTPSTSTTSTVPNSQSPVQGTILYGGRTQPPPPYQATHTQSKQAPAHPSSPHHQPPPYQPPPSAPLSYRPGISSDTQSLRSDAPYRHQPPIARVQPVNRVEGVQSPLSLNNQQHQQTLAYQLKALLAEREANPEAMQEGNKDNTPLKKSPSSLMEDVRRAVIQADMSIGKKPVISGPIHVSSTAQVVSTGQFVHSRTSPQKGSSVGATFQQKITRDSGTWSPVNASNSPGSVVLLSQRPIDSSLPLTQSSEAGDISAIRPLVSTDSASSFESPSQGISVGRSPKEILSVFDWTKEQVAQWLVVQGLENYVSTFVSAGITGPRLVNIDTKDLKNLGLLSSDDKNKIKRKVKELRQNLEKERKQIEKENKEREKLQRKAEKLAEKAEKRRK